MLRTAFLILLVLAVSIGGGGYSLWHVLQAREGVGVVTVGRWTAFPDMGTPDSDPYSKARVAREGVLALGRAEGLSFTAERDSSGDPLQRQCDYRVDGTVPAARFWTLYAADESATTIRTGNQRPAALHSLELLRFADDEIVIQVGPRPFAGNWLDVEGSGGMVLVLTLYDTPIASSTGLADVRLPEIVRVGCHA